MTVDRDRATPSSRRRAVRALALTIFLLGALLAPAAAQAAPGMTVAQTIPSPVTVGSTNVPGSIVVTNNNTGADGSLTLCNSTDAAPCPPSNGITLLPSCGGQDFTLGCDGLKFDPGVFSVDTPAFGADGSACEDMQFTVAVADPTSGRVRLTPTGGGHVTLPAPGSFCRIDFTLDVLSFPDIDWSVVDPGLQTVQIPEALAVSDQSAVTFARGQAAVTVKGAPAIQTTASAGVVLGGQVSDSAGLAGEYNPATGNVTFNLYGPGDATCSSAPVFTSTVAIGADGTATSAPATPAAAGTYRWIASYAGDANNNAAAGSCNDAGETVVIAKRSPTIATTASAGVPIGGQVTDAATLAGEHNPATGNVTFRLYGAGDTTCSNGAIFTSTVAIGADGTATSTATAPPVAGTYRWVASYAGDANNEAAAGACNDAGETVVVAKATPTIQGTASAGVTIGGQVSDAATLAGEHNPAGGNVTFRLYGPGDAGCSGAPAFSSTIAIDAGGTASSGAFTPTAPGTYRWTATYGGDANNEGAAGACNDPGATVTVAKATPSVQTNASAGVAIGGQVTAAANLAGEHNPAAGTMTFRLYEPGDGSCSGPAAFTSAVSVAADGTATSAPFTPPAPGTYRWIASFGGDAGNDAASGSCNDAGSTVTVTKATPTIATTASPSVALDGLISDSATLAGEFGPTSGTVTFRLYGPGDANCTAPAVFTAAVAIAGDGTASSGPFAPAEPGTYRWTASYAGDSNNEAAAGQCNDPGESVVVTKRSPAIQTNASPGVTIGGQVSDTATLAGEHNPTSGNVTFRLYGPADATCSGTPAFTDTSAIAGDGSATSASFTPAAAGTYRWIASYGGDANNEPAAGACNDAGETVVVAKATPAIQTTASAGVQIGGQVTDSATLTGEHNPAGGSVTFRLYGPGDATCSGMAAFTSTVGIGADGTVTSGAYTPTAPGTYRWVASYGGDANNEAAGGACNDNGESVTISQRAPGLSGQASSSVAVGGALTDWATLSGELNPVGGSVTFRLYGPGDTTCSAAPLLSSSVAIAPGGTATSPAHVATAPGTYRWTASYGGDANHAAIAGACNDADQSVAVSKATPSIVTDASDAVAVGGQVTDSATLVGEYGPVSGNVTFRLYGPQDPACSATPVFTSIVSIHAGGTATSQAHAPQGPGTYRWIASYAGDSHNEAAAGACGDPEESVTVGRATPVMTTNASPPVAVGGSIHDRAALAGEVGPTAGTITFRLYGPGDAACSGAPVFESAVAIGADGTATSAPATPPAAGTYRWVASYGGDANNAPASGTCGDPDETAIVGMASPAMTTRASGDVTVGDKITDSATLSGARTPVFGNVTFRLYGPDDAGCTHAPAFESTVAIATDGTAKSGAFETTAAGTYRWTAHYAGDANNSPANGACNDAGESVEVRVAASPLLCGGKKVALVDVFPEGSRMLVSGVAQPSLAGQRAKIVLESTGKTITTAKIGRSGAFAASAKLPAKRLRRTARYKAVIGKSRSVALKLMRRSYLTRAALRGSQASFQGKVTGDFRPGVTVTLLKITLCTKNTAIAKTKLRRDGTWRVSVRAPANASDVLFRARTNVLLSRRPFQTFTLPSPVSLSAARSR